MRRWILFAGFFALAVGLAFAGEMPEGWTPPKPSAELERIKSLAGTWKGVNPAKGGEDKSVTVTYKVTSGGSAVVETMDPDTSHEMVSVYRDKAGKLSMTHYCMLGNQPELELKSASDARIELDMSPSSHEFLKGEMHMHSLVLEWTPDGELKQSWASWDPSGKPAAPIVFTLKKA